MDIYWDNAKTPAVSAPFGDFFGQGLGRCQKFESAFFSNPEGKSFNCCVPMPFKSAFKIVLTNESANDIAMVFYDVDFTVGDEVDENTLYLHAHWRRENPTKLQRDYEFLPKVNGRGRFLGVNVSVIADSKTYYKSWWGEGECKVYWMATRNFRLWPGRERKTISEPPGDRVSTPISIKAVTWPTRKTGSTHFIVTMSPIRFFSIATSGSRCTKSDAGIRRALSNLSRLAINSSSTVPAKCPWT